jgi:hypothetical protein
LANAGQGRHKFNNENIGYDFDGLTNKIIMSKLFALLALALLFTAAQAQEATCTAAATEKKLAGAAKNSFLKKCEKDATAKCEAAATERKLAGAAKNSNVKKCIKDAVGETP